MELRGFRALGVSHVALDVSYSAYPAILDTIDLIADRIRPELSASSTLAPSSGGGPVRGPRQPDVICHTQTLAARGAAAAACSIAKIRLVDFAREIPIFVVALALVLLLVTYSPHWFSPCRTW